MSFSCKHSWLENGPLEDVAPIKNGDFPASHVRLLGGHFFCIGLSSRSQNKGRNMYTKKQLPIVILGSCDQGRQG